MTRPLLEVWNALVAGAHGSGFVADPPSANVEEIARGLAVATQGDTLGSERTKRGQVAEWSQVHRPPPVCEDADAEVNVAANQPGGTL